MTLEGVEAVEEGLVLDGVVGVGLGGRRKERGCGIAAPPLPAREACEGMGIAGGGAVVEDGTGPSYEGGDLDGGRRTGG